MFVHRLPEVWASCVLFHEVFVLLLVTLQLV